LAYDIDSNDNIYFVYSFQNKIEKYTPDGKLLFQAERPLNIKPNNNPQKPNDVVLVSSAMAVDTKDRLWISTVINIPEETGEEKDEYIDKQFIVLEIYSTDGILLGKISVPAIGNQLPWNPLSTPALGNIRIFSDRIYFIDTNTKMCVYEYKIIEN